MGYILDGIIALIVLFCVIRGVKKGAVRTAFSLLSVVVALILTFMFASPFSQFVEKQPFGQNIHTSVQLALEEKIDGILYGGEGETSNTTEGIIKALSVPEFMMKSIFLKSDFVVRNSDVTAAQAVADALASATMKVLCTIVLFVTFLLLLWLVRLFALQVFKLPILKQLNGLVGGAAGLVNGLFVSYLVLTAVSALVCLPAFSWLTSTTETSFVFKNIYENNVILSAIL